MNASIGVQNDVLMLRLSSNWLISMFECLTGFSFQDLVCAFSFSVW